MSSLRYTGKAVFLPLLCEVQIMKNTGADCKMTDEEIKQEIKEEACEMVKRHYPSIGRFIIPEWFWVITLTVQREVLRTEKREE